MMTCVLTYKFDKFCIFLTYISLIAGSHVKGLDDSILFRINWPGHDIKLLASPDFEKLELTTLDNEKFQCLIPFNYGEPLGGEDDYTGPNPLELLMPLFKKKICTLRLEAFWTYELCHGQWIKQYHEGREENGQKHQNYELGTTNLEELEKLSKELDEWGAGAKKRRTEVPQTKIEGVSMPYFAVQYEGGTMCDLTGNPRITRVLYVCYDEGRHSIFSIKETYTCEYEVIVLTSLLCQHPAYRPQEAPQTNLHCIPLREGTKRPTSLIRLEAESLKFRTHGTMLNGDVSEGLVRLEVVDEEDEAEIVSMSSLEEGRSGLGRVLFPSQPPIDKALVEDFLNGDHCLQGGAGWWKYEFCYGKSVEQFHEDKDGSKYSINLGFFDIDKHKQWLEEHPAKRFKPGRSQVSHFYSDGDYCDAIAGKRSVEVKLKCKESASPSSVTLYLLEPKICEYVLGVETSLVCPLLQNVDDLGLFTAEKPKEFLIENLDSEAEEESSENEHTKGSKEEL